MIEDLDQDGIEDAYDTDDDGDDSDAEEIAAAPIRWMPIQSPPRKLARHQTFLTRPMRMAFFTSDIRNLWSFR